MRITYKLKAFEQIRRAPKVQRELRARAEKIAAAARESSGVDGYIAVSGHGRTRDRAAVLTTDRESIEDNARDHTIVRSMGAGR